MGGEEVGHVGVGLAGLGEADVVPEGVGEGFEDDKVGVDAVAEEGAVEDSGSAEQEVAAAGDEKGGRKAVEVGVEGREHGVAGAGGADVLSVVAGGIG